MSATRTRVWNEVGNRIDPGIGPCYKRIIGDDDQIVPIGALPHGMCSTHEDQVNADLMEFLKA